MDTFDASAPKSRVQSIDVLRGIIMMIMALDHTRDFFTNLHHDPLDFTNASAFYFFTRWITHFCAPVFVFLSGTSAYLSLARGKTKKQASWLLFSRGLMLIIFEVTIIRLGWSFNFDYSAIFLQVIWALGCCMVVLSGLIFLPIPAIAIFGLVLVLGHNAFDMVKTDGFSLPILWDILHQAGRVGLFNNSFQVFVLYPIIPWVGVMALGYCMGVVIKMAAIKRNKILYRLGLSLISLFIIVRGINIYGDPHPWHYQDTVLHTFLDFLKCQKYPPSLCYLLMTLGPAITLLPVLENLKDGLSRFFTVYGRVPLFYYVLHIYLIHALALVMAIAMGIPADDFTRNSSMFNHNASWGFSLLWVYIIWISVVLILYYPCRWYMKIKMKHKKWWLSYL